MGPLFVALQVAFSVKVDVHEGNHTTQHGTYTEPTNQLLNMTMQVIRGKGIYIFGHHGLLPVPFLIQEPT
jgi:hypothetical protein